MRGLRAMLDRWRTKRDLYAQDGALVSGATIIGQVVSDLEAALHENGPGELVGLTEAARLSGYSADYLGRLVRTGTLPNYGRKHAPLVERAALPCKPGYLPPDPPEATIGHPKRRVASAVITAALNGTRKDDGNDRTT